MLRASLNFNDDTVVGCRRLSRLLCSHSRLQQCAASTREDRVLKRTTSVPRFQSLVRGRDNKTRLQHYKAQTNCKKQEGFRVSV